MKYTKAITGFCTLMVLAATLAPAAHARPNGAQATRADSDLLGMVRRAIVRMLSSLAPLPHPRGYWEDYNEAGDRTWGKY